MAYTTDKDGGHSQHFDHVISSQNSDPVVLPEGFIAAQGGYVQAGSDLIISGTNDDVVLLQNFFIDQPSGVVQGPGFISFDLAAKLAGSSTPAQYAQADGGYDTDAIGQIETSEGIVTALHANGQSDTLQVGSSVFQGDVIRTAGGANVGITFKDESTFTLDANGEMTLDEMVYDPDTGAGSFSSTLTSGVFSFVSGQISKVNPDAMTITTPVATIGIRGTQGVLKQADGGKLEAALLEEPGGFTGELILTNGAGSSILNQPNQYSSIISFTSVPGKGVVVSAIQISGSFGTKTIQILNNTRKNATARKAQEAEAEAQAEAVAATDAKELANEATLEADALAAAADAAAEAAANAEGAEADALIAAAEAAAVVAAAAASAAEAAIAEATALAQQAVASAEAAKAAAAEAALVAEAQASFDAKVSAIEQQINDMISKGQNPTAGAAVNDPVTNQPTNNTNQNTQTPPAPVVTPDQAETIAVLTQDLVNEAEILGETKTTTTTQSTTPPPTTSGETDPPVSNIDNWIELAASASYTGTSGNDGISGLDGNDYIQGGDGNDVIVGGDGSDTLNGGAGDDSIHGDVPDGKGDFEEILTHFGTLGIVTVSGTDTLTGGLGDDHLYGGNGDDQLFGDISYDSISGDGNDTIDGGDGNDQIYGNGGADLIYGGNGSDYVYGDGGGAGGNGDDNDTIYGEDGDDHIFGEGGNDHLFGGLGIDTLDGGVGADTLSGGNGDDIFSYVLGSLSTDGGDHNLDFSASDHMYFYANFSTANLTFTTTSTTKSLTDSSPISTPTQGLGMQGQNTNTYTNIFQQSFGTNSLLSELFVNVGDNTELANLHGSGAQFIFVASNDNGVGELIFAPSGHDDANDSSYESISTFEAGTTLNANDIMIVIGGGPA